MDTPGKNRRAFIVNGLKTSAATFLVPSGISLLVPIPPSALSDDPRISAIACWELRDLSDSRGKFPLRPMKKGVEFMNGSPGLSSKTPSAPATLATFGGEGWVELEDPSTLPLNSGAMTLATKIFAAKGGGLIQHGLVSLVLLPSGMVVAILQIEDAAGHMFRELPLSFVGFDAWHDLVLRINKQVVEFFIDGIIRQRVTITEKLKTIDRAPVTLGCWTVNNPPLPGFPQHVQDYLFQRRFTGKMDYAACWNRALTDHEVATLCRRERIGTAGPQPGHPAILAYNDFHDASRRKDISACEKLGLAMRHFMASDRKRPVYHLTAPMDGILDPAGAFYHNGEYHVYSYRNMVSLLACTPLAHYKSTDLVHWRDQPIGVWADSELDHYGIWLTNLFYDDEGTPSMIYTALGEKGKLGVLARSRDNLLSFGEKQAVMTGLPGGHHDGHTWKDGEQWYALTTRQYWGSRATDRGDAVILMTSKDLVNWRELGEIFSARKHPNPKSEQQKNGFTEFPYLLPFGDEYALILGTRPVRYWIGKFDKSIPAFIPNEPEGKLLDYMNPFHCFNPSITDRHDGLQYRRVILAMHLYTSGSVDSIPWYGVHVLPRTLSRVGNRLVQEPVDEITKLRGVKRHFENISIQEGNRNFLGDTEGDTIEIEAVFHPGSAKRFGLKVRASADGENATRIFYDTSTGFFGAEGNLVDSPYPELGQGQGYYHQSAAPAESASSFATFGSFGGRGESEDGEIESGNSQSGFEIKFRIFLDRSLLEIFVNGHTCSGIFNGALTETRIDLFSEGGSAALQSMDIWEMMSAWAIDPVQ